MHNNNVGSTGKDNDGPSQRLKHIVETLRGEDFPMDKMDINYSVGDMEIEDGHGGVVAVRDLTDQLGKETYGSAEDVIRSLQAVLHQKKVA